MTITPAYLTEATATGGGRNGVASLASGMLTITHASPKELGGSGNGHNPEELLALGWSACYLGAMRHVANAEKLGTVPEAATVTAKIGLGGRSEGGFGLKATLTVSLPGLDRATAEKITERGHFICPYSHATKGNIEVETVIV